MEIKIPFNRPYLSGNELTVLEEALSGGKLSGGGPYSKKCEEWLEESCRVKKALLVPSCTAALEMAAILSDIAPGDEIVMPSFTFVSTANAFVLRGGIPVFVDIREDTLNMDETKIQDAISPRTKAIVPVHYAGVGCEMDSIIKIARKHHLLVIEDAAQGILATYKGKPLGGIGHLSAISFHETKNIVSGEGGCILINDPRFEERAEIIREKGTDRSKFLRGESRKYSWIDLGSSYLPAEIVAAFLWNQFQEAPKIIAGRRRIWEVYHESFVHLEKEGRLRRPFVPNHCRDNAHIYYIVLNSKKIRDQLLGYLNSIGILAISHYVPLHSSPAGQKYGRTPKSLPVTDKVADRLLRLPLYFGLTEEDQGVVVKEINKALKRFRD